MAAELVAALEHYTDPSQLYLVALHLSGITTSALLPQFYQSLRGSPDPELRFIGLEGLLGTSNEASALAEIASSLGVLPTLRTRSLLQVEISGTRNSDPAIVASLGAIASSPDETWQRCAAKGLENIHSLKALPFLAQLLSSPDRAAREAAMSGLSRFVDNLPIQTVSNIINGGSLISQGPTPYRTAQTDKYSLSRRLLGSADETEYVQFWKSWWASMKSQLAPGQ